MNPEDLKAIFFTNEEGRRLVLDSLRKDVGSNVLYSDFREIMESLTADEVSYLCQDWGPSKSYQVRWTYKNLSDSEKDRFNVDIFETMVPDLKTWKLRVLIKQILPDLSIHDTETLSRGLVDGGVQV